MNLEERVKPFKNVEKGPTRVFNKSQLKYFTLYSLPNGISVFNYRTDLKPGKTYKKSDFDWSLEFDFKCLENINDQVIIKALGKPDLK